ncbi:antibiotic biosynthesis monooxygenase [uncultured Exiguobacterium sp.]|uniref:antibiotic biosynthesis monooxygenase n=1 Tax=uncultured Exiguobacterium sp. TaxID=202669 RepID=UPI0025EB5768|nr:antibiotic biosynthesis monooxygenase [uncultured Exiguobacterium sp.]
MFIQLKTFKIKRGSAVEMIERFSGKGIIEQQPGFLDLSVLHKKRTKEEEEVLVLIRWESEQDWKAWETSEVHLAGHRERRGQPGPSFILDGQQHYYDVIGFKTADL